MASSAESNEKKQKASGDKSKPALCEIKKWILQEDSNLVDAVFLNDHAEVFRLLHEAEMELMRIVRFFSMTKELKKRAYLLKSIETLRRRYLCLIERAEEVIKDHSKARSYPEPSEKNSEFKAEEEEELRKQKEKLEMQMEMMDNALDDLHDQLSDFLCTSSYWDLPPAFSSTCHGDIAAAAATGSASVNMKRKAGIGEEGSGSRPVKLEKSATAAVSEEQRKSDESSEKSSSDDGNMTSK